MVFISRFDCILSHFPEVVYGIGRQKNWVVVHPSFFESMDPTLAVEGKKLSGWILSTRCPQPPNYIIAKNIPILPWAFLGILLQAKVLRPFLCIQLTLYCMYPMLWSKVDLLFDSVAHCLSVLRNTLLHWAMSKVKVDPILYQCIWLTITDCLKSKILIWNLSLNKENENETTKPVQTLPPFREGPNNLTRILHKVILHN